MSLFVLPRFLYFVVTYTKFGVVTDRNCFFGLKEKKPKAKSSGFKLKFDLFVQNSNQGNNRFSKSNYSIFNRLVAPLYTLSLKRLQIAG